MSDQTLLDKSLAGLCLVYKLAFLRIGYDGPYTDYTTIGWPNRSYDPKLFRNMIAELGKRVPPDPGSPAGPRRFAAFVSRLWKLCLLGQRQQ